MSDELKPCPFCGGEASFVRRGDYRVSSQVSCDWCGAHMESGDEGERSGDSWNRRATPANDRDAVLEEAARAVEDRGMAEDSMVAIMVERWSERFAEVIRALKATPTPAAGVTGSYLAGVPCLYERAEECPDIDCSHNAATPTPITPSAVDEAEQPGVLDSLLALQVPRETYRFTSQSEAEQRGADRERAAVVAWARAEAVKCDGICDMIAAQFAMRLPSDARWWRAFADRVEAGDHIPPATESEAGRG